eukprot:TRINITY_DN1290_c0_g1_i2.p1 TRINITY_DN1290_c0_g1~~TRINITY_DN1290_c0_g1_i2.p1  ORF type:complete len:280 (+),score=61.80 TRINITY_DN1290_c0_g1_i2:111-950(+)
MCIRDRTGFMRKGMRADVEVMSNLENSYSNIHEMYTKNKYAEQNAQYVYEIRDTLNDGNSYNNVEEDKLAESSAKRGIMLKKKKKPGDDNDYQDEDRKSPAPPHNRGGAPAMNGVAAKKKSKIVLIAREEENEKGMNRTNSKNKFNTKTMMKAAPLNPVGEEGEGEENNKYAGQKYDGQDNENLYQSSSQLPYINPRHHENVKQSHDPGAFASYKNGGYGQRGGMPNYNYHVSDLNEGDGKSLNIIYNNNTYNYHINNVNNSPPWNTSSKKKIQHKKKI